MTVRIQQLYESDPKVSKMPPEPSVTPETDRFNNAKPAETDDPFLSICANNKNHPSSVSDPLIPQKPPKPDGTEPTRRRERDRNRTSRLRMDFFKTSKEATDDAGKTVEDESAVKKNRYSLLSSRVFGQNTARRAGRRKAQEDLTEST